MVKACCEQKHEESQKGFQLRECVMGSLRKIEKQSMGPY